MRISVFITSYNQKDYLVEAIESVLAQTLPASQIIIVDDCSQDGSPEVISGYASRYLDLITPIYHTFNQGAAQTRIDALKAVTGDFVSYVDGDDRYLPTKLEKEVDTLRKTPGTPIVFSNNYYMTAEGIRTGLWADGERPPHGHVFCQTFARDFPRRNLFRMELVQYQAWKQVGFHDTRLHLYEDWDMRIRLSRYYRVVYCDEPLSEIRMHGTGLSSTRTAEHVAALEYILQKNEALMDDLDPEECRYIRRKLAEWRARLVRRGAREALAAEQPQLAHRKRALQLYLQSLKYDPFHFDHRLILQIFMPHRAYELMKELSRKV